MNENTSSSRDFTIAFPAARLVRHGTTDNAKAHGSSLTAIT